MMEASRLKGLAELPKLTGLKSLCLAGKAIGDEGAVALATALTRLTNLHVGGCRIGAAGAAAIGKMGRLKVLWIMDNCIRDEGAAALMGLVSLQFLCYNGNCRMSEAALNALNDMYICVLQRTEEDELMGESDVSGSHDWFVDSEGGPS